MHVNNTFYGHYYNIGVVYNVYMNTKTKIKVELAKINLSVSALERKMGLGRGVIQNMLDRNSLKYSMAVKIANAIGKDIEWIEKQPWQ